MPQSGPLLFVAWTGANRQRGAGLNAFLLIGLGGMLGANARYLVSTGAANRFGVDFPYGTFLVNVTGSVLLGLILTLVADFSGAAEARYLLATGFLGAYTTFSTFTYETIALVRGGEVRRALVNVLGSTTAGVVGCILGILTAAGILGWLR